MVYFLRGAIDLYCNQVMMSGLMSSWAWIRIPNLQVCRDPAIIFDKVPKMICNLEGNNMSTEILQDLIQRYPNARLTATDQPLPAADFQAQKHKHVSRRASGGAVGIIRNARG